jgi:hypothetical protein
VVRAACDCARTALRYVPGGEDRPRLAIETAEAWCRGEATEQEVCAAAYFTSHSPDTVSTYTAGAYTAFAAANAAANAANAAANPISFSTAAASRTFSTTAAYFAGNAAAAAAAATPGNPYAVAVRAARAASYWRCAELVRARIPWAAVGGRLPMEGEE